jgi:hypothetical protein
MNNIPPPPPPLHVIYKKINIIVYTTSPRCVSFFFKFFVLPQNQKKMTVYVCVLLTIRYFMKLLNASKSLSNSMTATYPTIYEEDQSYRLVKFIIKSSLPLNESKPIIDTINGWLELMEGIGIYNTIDNHICTSSCAKNAISLSEITEKIKTKSIDNPEILKKIFDKKNGYFCCLDREQKIYVCISSNKLHICISRKITNEVGLLIDLNLENIINREHTCTKCSIDNNGFIVCVFSGSNVFLDDSPFRYDHQVNYKKGNDLFHQPSKKTKYNMEIREPKRKRKNKIQWGDSSTNKHKRIKYTHEVTQPLHDRKITEFNDTRNNITQLNILETFMSTLRSEASQKNTKKLISTMESYGIITTPINLNMNDEKQETGVEIQKLHQDVYFDTNILLHDEIIRIETTILKVLNIISMDIPFNSKFHPDKEITLQIIRIAIQIYKLVIMFRCRMCREGKCKTLTNIYKCSCINYSPKDTHEKIISTHSIEVTKRFEIDNELILGILYTLKHGLCIGNICIIDKEVALDLVLNFNNEGINQQKTRSTDINIKVHLDGLNSNKTVRTKLALSAEEIYGGDSWIEISVAKKRGTKKNKKGSTTRIDNGIEIKTCICGMEKIRESFSKNTIKPMKLREYIYNK